MRNTLRYTAFKDDGTYTIHQGEEKHPSLGVEFDGKEYRWINDKISFKVKPLKEKKVKKVNKKLAKKLPDHCIAVE